MEQRTVPRKGTGPAADGGGQAGAGGTGSLNRDHQSVLLVEAVQFLNVGAGGLYVDATFGAGGHTRAILEAGGRVLALDRDPESLKRAGERLAEFADRLELRHADFRSLSEILAEKKSPAPQGILVDLGLSSEQLLDAERGFSFRLDGPLDMRMDRESQNTTAADLLADLDEGALSRLLWRYGEDPASRRIARAVVRRRRSAPLRTTTELATLVEQVKRGGRKRQQRLHPATLTFQALRIAVNDELVGLEAWVEEATELLAPGGRFVAIAFHSLEDRAVKIALRAQAKGCRCSEDSPICTCGRLPSVRLLTRKPLSPDDAACAANPRARSARLRAAERLDA